MILTFIGSNSINSYSHSIVENILTAVRSTFEHLEVASFRTSDVMIQQCLGCNNCFINGFCPLDEKDDMIRIRKKLLQADIILFVSPVYANNVTGAVKTFIDRISYWLHLLPLLGKKGIILTTSNTGGNDYVNNYIEQILVATGIKVIAKFSIIRALNNGEQILQDCADTLVNLIRDDQGSAINEQLVQYFFATKDYINRLKEAGSEIAEIKYWIKTGRIYCDSIYDLSNFIEGLKANTN